MQDLLLFGSLVVLERLEQPRDQIRAAMFAVVMEKPAENANGTATKLVVRVLQDLVARNRFDSYADLAEALKLKCARLKIPYHAGLISDAIDQLERGGKTPLILRPAPRRPTARVEEPPPSHDEAVETLRRLGWPG